MSGLFGVVGGEPVNPGTVDRALAASPWRWANGHHRFQRESVLLVWGQVLENGAPAPDVPPPGWVGPCVAAAGRIDEVGGTQAGRAVPNLAGAWSERGPTLPLYVLGDYALAVWDEQRRTLSLARDPMGQRTLYVSDEGQRITFASDIATLDALTPGRTVEDASVRAFLCGDFMSQCATMFEDVEQIPPGAVLHWTPGSRRVDRPSLWSADPLEYASEGEYVDHFLDVFGSAVRARTAGGRSALLLSGGLDSPMIAAAAAREGADVVAYTFRTEKHPSADESPAARSVAEALGLEIVVVDWDAAPPLDGFPAMGPDPDDPYVGVYQACLDRVYEMARAGGARSLLAGDRGDLLFGDAVYGHLEMLLDGAWGTLVGDLAHERRRQETSWPDVVTRYVGRPLASSLLGGRRRRETGPVDGPPWLRGVPHPADTPPCAGTYHPAGPRAYGRRQRYRTVFTPMHTMGAIWTERHTMRHGLSSGDPWSDPRVVEFALRTPQSILNRTRDRKRLARMALRRLLPGDVVDHLGKVDPGAVFEGRMADVQARVRNLLDEPLVADRGWVDPEPLRRHYEAFLGGAPLDARFWWALSTEWWLRSHWS